MSARTTAGQSPQEFWHPARGPAAPADLDGWTLPRILDARAQQEPDTPVFRVRRAGVYRTITWAELRADVGDLAAGLHGLGLRPGERVAILGDACPDWIAADLAVLSAGGLTVGIYPTSSVEEVTRQVAHVGVSIFIAHRRTDLEPLLPSLRESPTVREILLVADPAAEMRAAGVVAVADVCRAGREQLTRDPDLFARMLASGGADDPMRLFFTSGSTGAPKAVVHTHRSLMLAADGAVIRHPAMRARSQRVVAFLPLSHVSPALNVVVMPFITHVVPHFGEEGQDPFELVREVRPTYLAFMPRHYQKLGAELAERTRQWPWLRRRVYEVARRLGVRAIEAHWAGRPVPRWLRLAHGAARRFVFRTLLATAGLDAVARAQTSSAAMPPSVAALWAMWGLDLREGYGSTESAGAIAAQLEPFPRPGDIGRELPTPWYETRLAEDGEIVFRSPILFAGYWNDPEATAAVMEDGWLHTGDLGELTPEGNIRLVGRKKDLIITSGGKSLSPQEIELPLKSSPYVSEVVAVGEGRKYVAALVELAAEPVALWAREQGIPAVAYADLAAHPAVGALIAGEIERANAALARVAQIKRFRILPRPLDAEQEEVTATRKVRRQVVQAHFQSLIDEMFDAAEEALIAAQVQSRLSDA
jgi:long-chain acyl-CoA synthetase